MRAAGVAKVPRWPSTPEHEMATQSQNVVKECGAFFTSGGNKPGYWCSSHHSHRCSSIWLFRK